MYKITFYVKASVKDIRFNVQLKGDETTELYSEDLLLKGDSDGSGEAFSATNERAVVQYSSSLYTEVCLDFSEGDIEDICNIIPESDYSKDNFIKAGEDSGLQAGERASEDSGPVIKQI